MDQLAKMHAKNLGFTPRSVIEGKIAAGEVLIAVGATLVSPAQGETSLAPTEERIGYCISSYRYLKRDELGVIYQMNIMPGAQRKLVAASLLKEVFERAPYGCKLFCCWCRQDLSANYFWESMGFVPLAFRADAKGKYAHIFWQRRIREGDVTTALWFPAKTEGGMMRQDRIVLPIPPGVHWSDEMPILLPEVQNALPEPKNSGGTPKAHKMPKPRKGMPDPSKGPIRMCRGQFAPAGKTLPQPVDEKPKPQKPRRQKVKVDPVLLAKAKELRDRYLEQFNAGMVLPNAKYEISRQLPIHSLRSGQACDLQFAIEVNRKSEIANRKSLPAAA
jgi:hypothetical protein